MSCASARASRCAHQVAATGEALDRTKEELRALAGSLIDAQEDERRRIARDLHDDLSQRLAALQIGLGRVRGLLGAPASGTASELRRLEQQVASLAHDVRRLSHRLHPAILDDLGLAAALRRLAEDFASSRAGSVEFIERDVPEQLPSGVSGGLYRVAQEALRNVAKHAGRDPVRVALTGEPGALRLIVEDAGPGFDPVAVRGRGGLGMHQYAGAHAPHRWRAAVSLTTGAGHAARRSRPAVPGGPMNRPRLLIAEDHTETREALRQLLVPDYEIVALVGDGQAAIDAVDRLQPDLVLLDISMPGLSGIVAARRLTQRLPGIKIIFVTAHADPLYLAEAFRIGARGYVVKHALDAELTPAVAAVLAGGTYRSPSVEPAA